MTSNICFEFNNFIFNISKSQRFSITNLLVLQRYKNKLVTQSENFFSLYHFHFFLKIGSLDSFDVFL